MRDRRLVLFAREPVAGRVKTRLAGAIGAAAARRLYEAMLQDLSEQLEAPGEWEAVLAHDGPGAGPVLSRLFGPVWRQQPQGDGDLGERLARVLAWSASAGAEATVVAGSDAPTLEAHSVREAFAALAGGASLVLAPSPDGGYALLGVSREVPADTLLEGVRWSTSTTARDTLAAAERLGLGVALLGEVPDVDTEPDLVRLSALLSASGPGRRTRAALAGIGRL